MKSSNFGRLRLTIVNTIYFVIIFIVALSIATLSLTRKINSYHMTKQTLVLNVKKPEVVISNSVEGKVDSLQVDAGQHVRKGDTLVKLTNDAITQKLETLEELGNSNLSAQTEAKVLQAQIPQFEIKAPRDGIVYQINIAEGAYLNHSTPMMILFADDDIKLTGLVNNEQYTQVQKDKTLDLYSPRFGQIFSVTLEGAGRVIPATTYSESKYELQFRFSDPNEGASFIQGEGLEVISQTRNDMAKNPAERIAEFWNGFIIKK